MIRRGEATRHLAACHWKIKKQPTQACPYGAVDVLDKRLEQRPKPLLAILGGSTTRFNYGIVTMI